MSATFGDIDNDGDADLYVTSVRGGNVLFANLGGGRFRDISGVAGVNYVGHSSGAVFFDYNRDGRLSQDEWHWSRRSFLQQDSNRDGVVSREEFSAPTPTGTTGSTVRRGVPHVIVVNPTQRWIDTGIDLVAGENITVQSEGTIRLSGNSNDSSTAGGANRRAANAPMPNHPAGALIARVGSGAPIFLGDTTGARNVTTGGRLYLSVNDDHLVDNSGQYRVTLTVRR